LLARYRAEADCSRLVPGSAAVVVVLLVAVWVIASISVAHGGLALDQPPFAVGGPRDVLRVLGRNLLVRSTSGGVRSLSRW
jgi:hypothetical protein